MSWHLFAAGSFLGIGSSLRQSQFQRQMAEYQAGVMRAQQARIIQEGKLKAAQKRIEGKIIQGQQRAAFGASGVRISGSPEETILDTGKRIEYQAKVIEAGFNFESAVIGSQAQAKIAESAFTAQQGSINAWGSLLLTADKIQDKILSDVKSIIGAFG